MQRISVLYQRLPKRLTFVALGAAVLTAATVFMAPAANADTVTLSPTSISSSAGSLGSGHSVTNLATKDQSGTQDDWSKYVEFLGAYSGYRTYTVPANVSPATVSAIEVAVNYRGPTASEQAWTWSLYNWTTSDWSPIGSNASAPSWGSWKLLSFASPNSAASFVSSAGVIRVQLVGSNGSDSADIDFESVSVASSNGTGSDADSVQLPPANNGFSYQLGGAYTPESGVEVVSRDRTVSPAGPGFYNICYVNLLQTQEDVPGQSTTNPPYGTTQWWINNHPDLLLKDSNGTVIIDVDWNEALFDVRTTTKRQQLLDIQDDWFQGCKDDGYQAIEPDNLDAFLRSSGLISFAQTKEYLKAVVPFVHDIGLAIAQKNTSDAADGYGANGTTFVTTVSPAQGFDFAIAEECAAFEECAAYTDLYGPLVFEIEYTDNNPTQIRGTTSKSAFDWICLDDGAQRSIVLRDRDVTPADAEGYFHQGC